MTPATAVIMNRLTRARAAGSRKIRPVVVNLVPDPSFRNPAAELYVHGHNTCELVEVPGLGLAGVTGARVEGRSGDNDTHIAPDGRNDPGRFRLGMRPGATFTASVSVYLPEPLTGRLNRAALRLIPGCLIGSRVHWTIARSAMAWRTIRSTSSTAPPPPTPCTRTSGSARRTRRRPGGPCGPGRT